MIDLIAGDIECLGDVCQDGITFLLFLLVNDNKPLNLLGMGVAMLSVSNDAL